MIKSCVSFLMRGLIKIYQWTLSPLIGPVCRYTPSCSHYTAESILKHGPASGAWLGLKRIARCHPWGGSGFDPVPDFHAHDCSAHGHCDSHPSPTPTV
ncbi:MAG: membrane protein insertion efficiency factor YidD [Alphaproteobacteria bacterium]|nr:membrane protein insertion efficiency factor YidD [Alphaproteobacteria bacterium]PHY01017.1 MAG: membrane protein insertion efficiency factor YidD [Rhodospirillaceae bacterium]